MEGENEEIDFGKLEQELETAVEADRKYARENAAKFRAVEQRVESYDEFRNIVLASGLQPLERRDIMGSSKLQQPLNPMYNGNQLATKVLEGNNDIEGPDTSGTNTESVISFLKTWKRTLKTDIKRYQYLLKLDRIVAYRILTSDIVGDLLGEIIIALNRCFSSEYVSKILYILKSLHESRRFSLSLQFLSKSEKKAANDLFEKMSEYANEEEKQLLMELKLRYLG